MKVLWVTFLFALPVVASTPSEYYKAIKSVLDSTEGRVSDARSGNLKKACKDSKSFYIAFEALEDQNIYNQYAQDSDQWHTRNLYSIHQSNLPLKFHKACVSGQAKELKEVANSIEGILFLE
jgi:hypothetical protein